MSSFNPKSKIIGSLWITLMTPFDWYTAFFSVHFKITNREDTYLAAKANVATAGFGFTLIKSLKKDFSGLLVNDVTNINWL